MPTKVEELKSDIDELRKLLEAATRTKVQDVLSIELRKMETTLISLKETADQQPAAVSKPSNVAKQIPTEKIRNYAWDQSDKFVKFYLTVPGVQNLDANLIALTTTETSVSLTISAPDKVSSFSIDKLLNNIVSEESYHKVKPDIVVIFLKKKKADKWPFITKTEKEIKESRDAKFTPEDKASDDPSDGLMGMMKKLYQEGDDQMKQTIAKAWTQSSGGMSSAFDPSEFP